MRTFWFVLYNVIFFLLLPVYVPVAKQLSKKRGGFSLFSRFFPEFKNSENRDLWIHCASIGEVNSAKPLIAKIKDRVVITTFTDYGADRARKLFPNVPVSVIPFDFKPLTDRFVNKLSVKKLLVYETEIWPSLLISAIEKGIEPYIVSGKITEKSYGNYRRFAFFLRPIVENIAFLGRSSSDVEKAKSLGFKRAVLVGDLKFDSVTFTPPSVDIIIEGTRKIVVWGSTHEGEEKIAEKLHFSLKNVFPEILTIIAPRHIGRVNTIKSLLKGKIAVRTETDKIEPDIDFYIVDTIGELVGFYGLGDVAVIGGTFSKDVGGHNPLEPMALGKPVVLGFYYYQFEDVVKKIKEAVVFTDENSIFDKIFPILRDFSFYRRISDAGLKAILKERGVTDKILKEVDIESL